MADAQTAFALPPTPEELAPLDPETYYGPIRDTLAPERGGDLTEEDMINYVGAAIDDAQKTGGSLPSFNQLMEIGITKIISELFAVEIAAKNQRTTPDNAAIDHFGISVKFPDAQIHLPVRPKYSGQTSNLYPNEARSKGTFYTAPLTISAKVEISAHYAGGRVETKSADIPSFEVSQFPIMVGSSRCHTKNLTREARKHLKEDPLDQGGYFVAKGEWVVELLENIRFNSLHVYLGLAKEHVRGEFISQPGGAFENSSQIIIRHLQNDMITIEVNSMKFQKLQIPFFLFFRLFGLSSDRDILSLIVGDLENPSPVDQKIIEIIDRALHLVPPAFEDLKDELSRQVITEKLAVILERFVTNPQSYRSEEEAVRFLTNRLPGILDAVFLPHVGLTAESRIPKLRFLGLLIYKTFLPFFGVAPPADRDSFVMKRVHGAGVSFAKAFKAMFNHSVISTLVAALRLELKQTDFARLTTLRIQEAARTIFNASADLTQLLVRSLTSGNKIIIVRRRAMMNRLASSALERKNMLNVYSATRRIVAHNAATATKGSVRAEKIRAVHSTYAGYVCPYQSADTGEDVGLKKQLACTATVCEAGLLLPLVARLAADPDIYPAPRFTNEELKKRRLCLIYVNGNFVGSCEEPWLVLRRYRGLRRTGRGITPQTTIAWKLETNEIEFWIDVGRITRALLIVDNNQAAYDAGARAAAAARAAGDADWAKHRVEFVQNVRYTKAHAAKILAGEIGLQDLLAEGVCEYITPEEMENCFLAKSVAYLYENRHNPLRPFTHCDVPQAIAGLVALVSPDANHTQPARITYETNQGRSTCGWYSLAWPFRADQLRFFAFYNQNPLVSTLASQFVMPSGMNMNVLYGTLKGNNQEDSSIVKKEFIQRGGFAGLLFRRQVVSLEKGESFGNPDAATTSGMKPHASYAKVVDGLVQVGDIVGPGDVLIGVQAREAAPPGRKNKREAAAAAATAAFVDRSVVNSFYGKARVADVFKARGADDVPFALVELAFFEPLSIGDKMSSRAGNKTIVAQVLPESEMPYDDEGNRPDIIVNPHSIPSRMTIGQVLEAFYGLLCSERGTTMDATAFRTIDTRAFSAALPDYGLRENGMCRLTDGTTGRCQDAASFVGPTYIQRLQKYVSQNIYVAPPSGPTDALTGQPLDGKSQKGGLRLGEMELWVLMAQGVMHATDLKIRGDSDGRTGYYCRCGRAADYNPALSIYNCLECGELADLVAVPTRQAALVLHHEIQAIGVDLRFNFGHRRFETPASAFAANRAE